MENFKIQSEPNCSFGTLSDIKYKLSWVWEENMIYIPWKKIYILLHEQWHALKIMQKWA